MCLCFVQVLPMERHIGSDTASSLERRRSILTPASHRRSVRRSRLVTSCEVKTDQTAPAKEDEGDKKEEAEAAAPIASSTSATQPDAWTYLVGEEGEFDRDLQLLGSSRRRFMRGISLGLFLAIGGNLFGSTSSILSTFVPEDVSRSLRLDILYPIRGFKRCYIPDQFEFVYPQKWLQDPAVALYESERNTRPLDLTMRRSSKRNRLGPEVAFGPPRGDSKENVSVVKSTLLPGFTLRGTLGTPEAAAKKLLDNSIAPAGSSRTATFISARERNDGLYYEFEYRVEGPGFDNHTLSVITFRERDNALYTFTILAPQPLWPERKDDFALVADSFRVSD